MHSIVIFCCCALNNYLVTITTKLALELTAHECVLGTCNTYLITDALQ